jgi:hypothetical protein
MKNSWLNRFRIGRRVRYKGPDKELSGKTGLIIRIPDNWVDVLFEIPGLTPRVKNYTVEKEYLEII